MEVRRIVETSFMVAITAMAAVWFNVWSTTATGAVVVTALINEDQLVIIYDSS